MKQRVLFLLLFFCSFLIEANETALKLYRPYGELVAPVIKKRLTGHCLQQSQIIVREDAWLCTAEGVTYDPCFVKSGNQRTEALCPQSPWIGDSVQIKVVTPLNNAQNQTLDMSQSYPWAVELANGERCLALASKEFYNEMPIRYRCTSQIFLVGHLQRCKNTWSILEKTPQGTVTVELAKAWF